MDSIVPMRTHRLGLRFDTAQHRRYTHESTKYDEVCDSMKDIARLKKAAEKQKKNDSSATAANSDSVEMHMRTVRLVNGMGTSLMFEHMNMTEKVTRHFFRMQTVFPTLFLFPFSMQRIET